MAYLTADELLDTEDGFTEWNEDAAAGLTEETLEQALAEERLAELESELEQDEHPVNYDAELETEEEEAAPVSDKRLKRRSGRIYTSAGGSSPHGEGFPDGGGGMEQAGPEQGTPGAGPPKISVEMCRWNTRWCRSQSSSPDG